jgi:hypothetical protein
VFSHEAVVEVSVVRATVTQRAELRPGGGRGAVGFKSNSPLMNADEGQGEHGKEKRENRDFGWRQNLFRIRMGSGIDVECVFGMAATAWFGDALLGRIRGRSWWFGQYKTGNIGVTDE